MAAKLEIEKRGMKFKKNCSPLKLLSQSQPGSHLGRRAEPLEIFLENNHPMTISS
jgi:hypothetical protein